MTGKNFTCTAVIILLFITGQFVTAQNTTKSKTKTRPVSPKEFRHSDVGSPSISGVVTVTSNGIDINAGGEDIWGKKDEFNFVYIEKTGDFDFVSRIESLTAAHLYTKAGIMAREDLSADSKHIFFQVFPDNNPRNKNNGGYEFQYRQEKGVEMKAIYPASFTGTPEFPVAFPNTWIRLQRSKNDFTGYYSTDGNTWKVFTTYTLELPSKIYLGLALTSHNPSHAASAKFRNISELIH
jgi:hypothetical protein